MPTGLVRYQRTGDLHFITFSTFRHRPILGTPQARDKFLEILQQTNSPTTSSSTPTLSWLPIPIDGPHLKS